MCAEKIKLGAELAVWPPNLQMNLVGTKYVDISFLLSVHRTRCVVITSRKCEGYRFQVLTQASKGCPGCALGDK